LDKKNQGRRQHVEWNNNRGKKEKKNVTVEMIVDSSHATRHVNND